MRRKVIQANQAGMAADVIFSLLKFVVHVGDFADAFILGKFGVAVIGVERAVHPVLRNIRCCRCRVRARSRCARE